MSVLSIKEVAVPVSSSGTEIAADARRRVRRRRLAVWAARLALAVVIVGGWQLFTEAKIVDKFFFGQPTGIVTQLKDWIDHGTQFGSLWLQVWITMKEALLGFLYGVLAGVLAGVVLGQVRFLADVIGPYIKMLNAIPRIVLGSIFTVAFGLGTLRRCCSPPCWCSSSCSSTPSRACARSIAT